MITNWIPVDINNPNPDGTLKLNEKYLLTNGLIVTIGYYSKTYRQGERWVVPDASFPFETVTHYATMTNPAGEEYKG